MFKKFDPKTDVASSTKVKSSVQRSIRAKLLEQMPLLAEPSAPRPEPVTTTDANGEASTSQAEAPTVLDAIWPRKEDIALVKCRERVSIVALQGQPLFFNSFDGPFYPTLHLLHRYPDLLPRVQTDRGAVRFILGGAALMAPGLVSAGAALPDAPGLPEGRVVAVYAQGKELACAVGVLKMSTEDIKSIRKGVAIDVASYLNDDLWLLCGPDGKGLA